MPWVEGFLAIVVLLGIKTRLALGASGLFFISLAFGQMLVGGHDTVARIAIFMLIVIAGIMTAKHDQFALVEDED